MKIATYNVNSLRKRLPLVLAWLEQHKPDVMCLQETKVQDSEFPIESFKEAGYQATFRGMKSYNGVATLSRATPEFVQHGFCEGPENEDVRILQTTVDGVTIINTYVPQGHSIKSDKYQYKLAWFRRMRDYLEQSFQASDSIVWLGDLNIAPEPIDVYHPDRRVNDVDFHIDARNAFLEVVRWGLTDTFRRLHPDRIQYTYWDYFRNAFQNNWGWRIDHILVTAPLIERCRAADVDVEPRKAPSASDHTVMWAEFT
ncbi:MAG: exodeoxyribonuclease III [Bryobacteraceae bacterium]